MYILTLIVHVVVCFVLIMVVLLQAGRGGGFSDMMGGGQPQSIFGTQTNAFMTRATEVCAVVFIITSLTLGMMSTQKGKSLMEKESLKHTLQKNGISPDDLKKALAAAGASQKETAAKAVLPEKEIAPVSAPNTAAAASVPAASPAAAGNTVSTKGGSVSSEKTTAGNAR